MKKRKWKKNKSELAYDATVDSLKDVEQKMREVGEFLKGADCGKLYASGVLRETRPWLESLQKEDSQTLEKNSGLEFDKTFAAALFGYEDKLQAKRIEQKFTSLRQKYREMGLRERIKVWCIACIYGLRAWLKGVRDKLRRRHADIILP